MCIHNNIKVHQSKAQYNIALLLQMDCESNGLWVQCDLAMAPLVHMQFQSYWLCIEL